MASTAEINDQIVAGINSGNSRVVGIIVTRRIDKEINRRAEILEKALEFKAQIDSELKKIQPRPTAFDGEGKPVGQPTFTAEQTNHRKKLKELDGKYEQAFGNAFPPDDAAVKPNYEGLEKLLKDKVPTGKDAPAADAGGANC